MIVEALKRLMAAMAAQLEGTVAEIDERSMVAVVKVQTLLQLMAFVADTIVTATHSKDTPDENYRIMRSLEQRFEAVERDTLTLAKRAARYADVKHEITAGALAQLRAVTWAAAVEEMVA